MVDAVKDFAYSTVATAPSPTTSGTALTLQTGDGAKFPTGQFSATMWPVGAIPLLSNAEIVRASVTVDTVTMTRGQEGTTPQPVVSGYQFAQTITAGFIAQMLSANVTSFNTRTGAISLQAGDMEGLFASLNQIFLGTGSGTGQLIGLLAGIGLLFTASGQLIVGTGSTTGGLLAAGASGTTLMGGSTVSWGHGNLTTATTTSLTGLLTGNGSTISSVAAPTGTVVGASDTQTLTNKRLTRRVLTIISNPSAPTINTDNEDVVHISAQAAAITSFTTNLTGTPVDGDMLHISITGTAAIAITWGAKFESSTVTVPSTTFSTNRLDVGFIWNTETSAWRCVAVA